MPDQPLRPFSPPTDLFAQLHLPSTFSPESVVIGVLCVVFIFWAVYTVVAIYHWLKYSHASWIALPAIAVHLTVSIILISYAFSGALLSTL